MLARASVVIDCIFWCSHKISCLDVSCSFSSFKALNSTVSFAVVRSVPSFFSGSDFSCSYFSCSDFSSSTCDFISDNSCSGWQRNDIGALVKELTDRMDKTKTERS